MAKATIANFLSSNAKILLDIERHCPICGEAAREEFWGDIKEPIHFSPHAFSSRKVPEFMHLPMVRCLSCATVYAARPYHPDFLEKAYREAIFTSHDEAEYAAATYYRLLKPFIDKLPSRKGAVDVGAGSGALLPYLLAAGFSDTIGIEPSLEAIKAAKDNIQPLLVTSAFSSTLFGKEQMSLVCACQTLEHVHEPMSVIQTAYEILASNGIIAVVTHDYKWPINRILGRHSPIADLSHLQLFCPESIRHALEKSGFKSVLIRHFTNRYPLGYWLRLLPLPFQLKEKIQPLINNMSLASIPLSFAVGNMFVIGRKTS